MKGQTIQVIPFTSTEDIETSINERRQDRRSIAKASDLFEPLTKLLKVCGLYYDPSRDNGGKKMTGHLIYCIFLQLLVLAMSFRYLTIFRTDTSHTYKKIGLIGLTYYYFLWNVYSLVSFYSNWRYLPQFYIHLDKYGEIYGLVCNIAKTKRKVKTIVLTVSTIIIMSSVIFPPLMFFNMRGQNLILITNFTPFDKGEGIIIYTGALVVGVLSGVYHFIIAANTAVFMLSIHMLKQEFMQITNMTKEYISNKKFEDLDQLRLQHQDLSNVIERGNPLFRHVAGFGYCYSIPIVCLLLFGVTTSSLDMVDVTGLGGMMVTAILGIFIITYQGAHLNDTAHAPLPDLYTIPIRGESQATVNQIQQFISQLNGQKIGVSVYGLFVIDHSTTLMIFGTIISYVVIVVQFSITPMSQTSCNCTVI